MGSNNTRGECPKRKREEENECTLKNNETWQGVGSFPRERGATYAGSEGKVKWGE